MRTVRPTVTSPIQAGATTLSQATSDAPVGVKSRPLETPVNSKNLRGEFESHRLGILLIDGSASMAELGHFNIRKCEHVHKAIHELIAALVAEEKRFAAAYSLALVYFSDDQVDPIVIQYDNINEIPKDTDFNSTNYTGGGATNIGLGLQTAYSKIARPFVESPSPLGKNVVPRATIVVLSDGMCDFADQTRTIAAHIRTTVLTNTRGGNATISIKGAFLESPHEAIKDTQAAEKLMKDITGNFPDFFKKVRDAETLKNFYLYSLTSTGK